ncbi:glycosyl hydrolase, partial [Natronoarchaeum mannanilyticum]
MTRDGDAVAGLVESLTRAEKLDLVRGAVDPEGTATGYVPGVERLGIPELRLVDGPLGVRIPGESATAFPAPIA